jgi:uncharacterized membrane-anchored protein YhcB (DUF1043 family)
MIWLIGIGCFLGGAALGAFLFKTLKSDEVRIDVLEQQLQTLTNEHENYKNNVHAHFSSSAQLLNRLTESYKDVYVHMADGARALCPDYISNQLKLSSDEKALLRSGSSTPLYNEKPRPVAPPLDYAPKTGSDQKHVLDEDFGVEKVPETPASPFQDRLA